MIHEDAGLMKALRRALGIKVRNQFVVGEPYALQLLKAKKRAAENYERVKANGKVSGAGPEVLRNL